MSERESDADFAVRMGAYLEARQAIPFEDLCERFAGKVFAWGPDGKTIVASADSYESLDEQLRVAGYDPSRCIYDAVDYELFL